ncbi:MAG: response regulator [Phycisphaeraceae bacterium]|nr:response regulator [Phycisphaeraceae bacterium]
MPGKLDGVRILIVDDDRDVAEAMDVVLRSEGADTHTVADGNAAILACQDGMPDVVVLDMMLPRRSGFLVLEKIKGHEDSPLVIMVTANEGKRHQAYAENLGVDDYLIKPVPMGKLVETTVALLKQREEEEDDADDSDE